MSGQNSDLDLQWFRSHLLDDILPHWLASVTEQGLFLSQFDYQWRPLHRNFGTLVSQGRLLYNFSQGYTLTGDKVFLNAVEGGAQFLLKHFRDQKNGGWYWSCNLDGTVKESRKDGYGHAFTLFGLTHAFRCTGNPEYHEAMLYTWEALQNHFRDQAGGYYWRMTEDFDPAENGKSQNPTMHLFEALLTAATVGGDLQMLEEARRVGDFVLHKLVRPEDRRLPEFYDVDWHELPPEESGQSENSRGGRLDVGHSFEWAYLTSFAAEKGLPDYYNSFANSFMLNGLALGFDWQAGGIYSPTTPSGQLINQRKGWWEQCEATRALINFVIRHRRDDLIEPCQKMIAFIKSTMVDPKYGGWYPAVGPGINPQELEKGNEWKLDYHVVGMCMEAIRLAEAAKVS